MPVPQSPQRLTLLGITLGSLIWLARRRKRKRAPVQVNVDAELLSGPHATAIWRIKVVNGSRTRRFAVTRVWFETIPQTEVRINQPPAQLGPSAEWETWIDVRDLPAEAGDVSWLGRVELDSGQVIESTPTLGEMDDWNAVSPGDRLLARGERRCRAGRA
jgi:hypothetical protein